MGPEEARRIERQRKADARAAREREAADAAEAAVAGAMDPNLIPLGAPRRFGAGGAAPAAGPAPPPAASVPAVEWWDAAVLTDPAAGYGQLAEGEGGEGALPALRTDKFSIYVEVTAPGWEGGPELWFTAAFACQAPSSASPIAYLSPLPFFASFPPPNLRSTLCRSSRLRRLRRRRRSRCG